MPLGLLVRASSAYLRSRPYSLPIQIETTYVIASYLGLCSCVTYFGHNNISFCEPLKFNTFMSTLVYFTIFVLNWHYFTSYSMALPM